MKLLVPGYEPRQTWGLTRLSDAVQYAPFPEEPA